MQTLKHSLAALLSLCAFFLPACYPVAPTTRPSVSVPQQIAARINGGAQIAEVAAPSLEFPPDVYPAQVKKYFSLEDAHFALVLQPSMNVPLDTDDLRTTFVGVLYAPARDTVWRKLFVLDAAVPGNKNNPYWLWTANNSMYVSIVDQNGAGSGEGTMKVLKLDAEGDWNLDSCYYFGGSYNGPDADGDYFAFSAKLDRQQALPLDQCAGWGNLRFSKT